MASTKKVVSAVKQDDMKEMIEDAKVLDIGFTVKEVIVPAKVGVGSFCKDKILNSNWTNKEILEEVLKVYPTAKTTYACIAWYRSDLRSKGLISPRVFAKKEVPVVVPAVV